MLQNGSKVVCWPVPHRAQVHYIIPPDSTDWLQRVYRLLNKRIDIAVQCIYTCTYVYVHECTLTECVNNQWCVVKVPFRSR